MMTPRVYPRWCLGAAAAGTGKDRLGGFLRSCMCCEGDEKQSNGRLGSTDSP